MRVAEMRGTAWCQCTPILVLCTQHVLIVICLFIYLVGLVASCSMAWSESDACVAIRGTVVASTIGGIIVAMATPMYVMRLADPMGHGPVSMNTEHEFVHAAFGIAKSFVPVC